MENVRRAVVVAATLVAGACGGSSPSGPSTVPTPPPAPTFRDGWTEQSVPAAIAPAAPAIGAQVTVLAPGYLPREAAFDGSPFYLWPQEEGYVRQIAYSVTGRLLRWEAPGFGVTMLADDPDGVAALEDARAEIAAAAGLAVARAEGATVTIVVNPADPEFAAAQVNAVTRLRLRGYAVVGAEITFRAAEAISGAAPFRRGNLLLHELGHVIGLGHVADPDAVMQTFSNSRDRRFSAREQVTLRMMYRWRRPGNAPPDRDPSVAGAAAGTRTVVIVD
jgi:hypothetical protein